jgi:hypothetical protein
MALLDDVKVALRVTSDAMDVEVQALVDSALADMRRAGVDEALLAEDTMHPLVRTAVMLYCKAGFGYDNSEADRFMRSYKDTLATVMNSPTGMAG